MTPEREKAFEELLKGSFWVDLNMNDTFAFACADSEKFNADDFDLMVPVIAKYGQSALTAYAAVRRGAEPITCPCGHDGPDYQAAKKEIEAIKAANEYFMMD